MYKSSVYFEGRFNNVMINFHNCNESRVVLKTRFCPSIETNNDVQIVFGGYDSIQNNMIYEFPKLIGNSHFQRMEGRKGTQVMIEQMGNCKLEYGENISINLENSIIDGNIKLFGKINFPKDGITYNGKYTLYGSDIFFEGVEAGKIREVVCKEASGRLFVDIDSIRKMKRGERMTLLKYKNISNVETKEVGIQIEWKGEKREGEQYMAERVDDSLQAWIEYENVDNIICIIEKDNDTDEELCDKRARIIKGAEEFYEKVDIKKYGEIEIESFVKEEILIENKQVMNISLRGGKYFITSPEKIDVFKIDGAKVSSNEGTAIKGSKLFFQNSTMSNIVISEDVDTYITIPVTINGVNLKQKRQTIIIKDIQFRIRNMFDFIAIEPDNNTQKSYIPNHPSETHIIIENATGYVELPRSKKWDSVKISNSSLAFIASSRTIGKDISINNSFINVIYSQLDPQSLKNSMSYINNEIIFENESLYRNVSLSTNSYFINVQGNVTISNESVRYKDLLVSYSDKVRLESKRIDTIHYRFKDLVLASNLSGPFMIVDRLYLETSPAEILINAIEFAENKRPNIYMNFSIFSPTLIIIKSMLKHIPPRIHINNISLGNDDMMGVFIPFVCADLENLTDFDISFPEIDYMVRKKEIDMKTIGEDYEQYFDNYINLKCIAYSFERGFIIEEEVKLRDSVQWIIFSSIVVVVFVIIFIMLIFIHLLKKRNNVKSKRQ